MEGFIVFSNQNATSAEMPAVIAIYEPGRIVLASVTLREILDGRAAAIDMHGVSWKDWLDGQLLDEQLLDAASIVHEHPRREDVLAFLEDVRRRAVARRDSSTELR